MFFKKYVSDLRTEFKGYNGKAFSKDLMAGLTVAAVALPLALAFGVSSGADAAAGLVTAIFAGLIIGAFSGASYQISGPTGAMSAILLTLSVKYGIQGVLMAGFISGVILVLAAIFKIGRLVSYIPSPVITGFTSGIAIIIALGQIDNFFGTKSEGSDAIEKLISYGELGFSPNWTAVIFGASVVLIMLIYPKKLTAYVPSSLASIIIVLIANMIIFPDEPKVAEVGAIPKSLFTDNALLKSGFDFSNIKNLITPAISIAALGMIESLLCGASAGKMKNEKIDATRELVAQGVGNMVIPLFGGVPATAAIARTSVAIKSGGQTRIVSIFHSVTLILSMFLLGGVMSRIPLSALAGVLMVTAWRMNEWEAIKQIFSKKLKESRLQFIVTMIATVVFDLTIAIVAGVVAAMLIFILKSSKLEVAVSDVDTDKLADKGISGDHTRTRVVYLSGPLFFGTQDILTTKINELKHTSAIVLSMRGVPNIDDSAINELLSIYNELKQKEKNIVFCGVCKTVMGKLEQAGFVETVGNQNFYWDAVEALKGIESQNAVTV
ncbi:MAG: SulP family inorganic anion transporter [Ruminococcus sp.]|nr:SulP family inorganic anion transporter [Ruminococcus sp.]